MDTPELLFFKNGGYLLSHLAGSTIDVVRLNFSVRNGKRWNPDPITTLVSFFSFCFFLFYFIDQPEKEKKISKSKPFHKKAFGLLVLLGFTSLFYTCNLSTSSSSTTLNGNLFLKSASRLDAFSAYPYRTWLLSHAPGGTSHKPAVRPARSSRTSASTPQISYAHNR